MLVVTIRPGRPLMAAGGTWGLSDQPVSRSQQGPQILLGVRPVRARSSARASASNALHGPLGAMNGDECMNQDSQPSVEWQLVSLAKNRKKPSSKPLFWAIFVYGR